MRPAVDAGDEWPDHAALGELLRDLADCGLGTVLGNRNGVEAGRTPQPAGTVDPSDLESQFREHRESLVSYARRHVDPGAAEDVVQRAFEKIWRRCLDLAELNNPTAYIVTAVRNEIHRDQRRRMVAREREAPDGPGVLEHAADSADVSGQVSARATIAQELTRLSPREREAVVLRLQWQLSVAEAAEVMGVSTGAVKGYTHHGVRKLRERLEAA